MSLYDILACPTCHVHLDREGDALRCTGCATTYPIVNGVPVVFPDGSVPDIRHEAELLVRDTYNPWVHRLMLQSLFDHQVVLEVGSGNMTLDDPCIIRMDVTLSPYVDLVADVHALPFLPGSLDLVFSLAVFEHLHDPFVAARSIYNALKDGAFIYHECNFVYPYHGYPHHYFNASLQGMEQIFAAFIHLRKGVATYQMPSFTLESVLRAYLGNSRAAEFEHGRRLTDKLQDILSLDLRPYDIYFSEPGALNVAAGTYLAGVKQTGPHSTTLPPPIADAWRKRPDLQERFPVMNDVTVGRNVFLWAREEGRREYPAIAQWLDGAPRFNKRGAGAPWSRAAVRAFPVQEAPFGAIGFEPANSMQENARIAAEGDAVPPEPRPGRAAIAWRILRGRGPLALIRESAAFVRRRLR